MLVTARVTLIRVNDFCTPDRTEAQTMTSHLLHLILTLVIQHSNTLVSAEEETPSGQEFGFPESTNESESNFHPMVAKALEFGFQEATKLFETIEPGLYAQNLAIPADHPQYSVAAINHQVARGKNLSRYAYAKLRATEALNHQLAQFRNDTNVPKAETPEFPMGSDSNFQKTNCLNHVKISECNDTSRFYRTADGTCNNLVHPNRGSSFQPFARYLPQEYDDDISTVRKSVTGNELPSARRISTSIHLENGVPKASAVHTLMIMQWGQFLDHDLTLAAQTRAFNNSVPKCCNVSESHPDCLPIVVPLDDPHFNGSTDCMEFVRSAPSPRPDCGFGPREQLNQLTSWLDGSMIYGSTEEEQQSLRLFRSGKMKYHKVSNQKPLLPRLQRSEHGECRVTSPRLFCFRAGDMRVNEHPGLAVMHTIWLRQHNTIAQKLEFMNPHWSEENVFQETRKIVIAQLQHITFREFLPLVLGPNAAKTFGLRVLRTGYYNDYNSKVDASIPNAFGSAAFRFGHSLVESRLPRWDEGHTELPYRVNLSLEFMTPTNLHKLGEIDRITLGLVSQRPQERHEFITTELTNHLFQSPAHKGLDLAAINIQRGRDHGLAPYLKWREACGLLKPLKRNGPIVTWDDFEEATGLNRSKVDSLSKVYENPWDVDLFPGGMLEPSVRGGLVGKTFACIIGQTFRNLRRGDRFWYENAGQFSSSQLQAIRNTTLARVICDTSDSITSIQPVVFLAPQLQRNLRASCADSEAIPHLDLHPWNRVSSTEEIFHNAERVEAESNKPTFYSLSSWPMATDSFVDDVMQNGSEESLERTMYNTNFTRRYP